MLQVYITMSKEEKQEGKAAVDLLGSYFGKSGASWIMQVSEGVGVWGLDWRRFVLRNGMQGVGRRCNRHE